MLSRRTWLAICLPAALLVGCVGALLWQPDLLLIEHIRFEGNVRATDAGLRHLMRVRNGSRLWEVSPREISERIAAHPWVRSVEVTRSFPDTLIVRVVENEPVALLSYKGRLIYVTQDGQPFLEATIDDADYPILLGLDPHLDDQSAIILGVIVREALAVIDGLDERAILTRSQIASVTFGRFRGFTVRVEPESGYGPSEIIFGFDHYERQFDHLMRALAQGLDLGQGVRVDLAPAEDVIVEKLPALSFPR